MNLSVQFFQNHLFSCSQDYGNHFVCRSLYQCVMLPHWVYKTVHRSVKQAVVIRKIKESDYKLCRMFTVFNLLMWGPWRCMWHPVLQKHHLSQFLSQPEISSLSQGNFLISSILDRNKRSSSSGSCDESYANNIIWQSRIGSS